MISSLRSRRTNTFAKREIASRELCVARESPELGSLCLTIYPFQHQLVWFTTQILANFSGQLEPNERTNKQTKNTAKQLIALPLLSAVPAPAPVQTVHPAPPAQVKSYSVETGHQIAHDHVVTSPVIKSTVHSPVFGSQPIIGQVPVAAPAVIAAPAPLPVHAPLPYKA